MTVNAREKVITSPQKATLTPLVVDLCCGMGGLSLAAKQMGMKVVAGVDKDAAATRTYGQNFPEAKVITGSVRSSSVVRQSIECINEIRRGHQPVIIVSGPPCQGFSIAGTRDPKDPRNQILLGVARFVVAVKPRCALIENVARILDPNHSDRLKKLSRVLTDGGYHLNEIVLNAEDFGVPQRRKRAFFLITRRFLDPKSLEKRFKERKCEKVRVIDVLEDLPKPRVRPDRYTDDCEEGLITNHFAMQHSESVKEKIAAIPQGGGPMSYRKLDPLGISNTLISGNRAPPAHYEQSRSITVREALRLQGFPDDFRVYGPFSRQMGQVTNAVPPPLAKVALEVLCEAAGLDSNG